MKKYQRGFELTTLIYWGVALAVVGMLAAKVVPSVLVYNKTLSAIKKTASEAPQNATVPDIRKVYFAYSRVDDLELKPEELDITKEGGQIVISFAYDKKIELFGPVSLLIEYKGSTAK
ncbi:MAG: putative transrane protein [Proteobacteria bacterium]|nr:putative transrane protein [Pseudomonadota bacterium]